MQLEIQLQSDTYPLNPASVAFPAKAVAQQDVQLSCHLTAKEAAALRQSTATGTHVTVASNASSTQGTKMTLEPAYWS
jgi:hypothetical protein